MATDDAKSQHEDEAFPYAVDRPLDIVIVGGSLGGLSTALALKRLPPPANATPSRPHHRITILERNPTALLHNQGAGIVAGGDTLAFFKRYDRCQRPLAVSSQRRQYLDQNGHVVHKKDMVQNMTSWDLAYYLLRANVDRVESAYCDVPPEEQDGKPEGQVLHRHGCKVVDLEEAGNKVIVHYETSNDNSTKQLEADLVIGADGPSSTIRSLFHPTTHRTYAGYVALRGTVPEHAVSASTHETFSERFTFFHAPGLQILAYLIPGPNGSLTPGHRLINFVYYTNFPSPSLDTPSAELKELMTDIDGKYHRITMPPGKTSPAAWEKQRCRARDLLPPQFAELVCATQTPFVQAITDVLAPTNDFLGGKVLLVGDALAGFRPHTVASTSQAAFDAMALAELLEGRVGRGEWKERTLRYARVVQELGVWMGERSQHVEGGLGLEEYVRDRELASGDVGELLEGEGRGDGGGGMCGGYK